MADNDGHRGGTPLRAGETSTNPEMADLLEALGSGRITGFADPAVAGPLVAAMDEHGGLVSTEDLAAYEVLEREPLVVELGGARILTNPPPSFGGSLVARGLAILGSAPREWTRPEAAVALLEALVEVDAHHRPTTPQSVKGTTNVSIADASPTSCQGASVTTTQDRSRASRRAAALHGARRRAAPHPPRSGGASPSGR